MKTFFRLTLVITLLACGLARADDFRLVVEAGPDGRLAPAHYANVFGCNGGNVSPALRWSGAPAGTRSFVVTMYDPDAPTGSGWWHWVVANLPAGSDHLNAAAGNGAGSALPAGARTIAGDNGAAAYLGSCPPVGQTHRYVFTVHALKVDKLDLPANATPALVGFMAWANGLGKASVTLLGSR